MKIFLTLISLMITSSTFASNLVYKWPSINGLSVNNACATEKEFHSLKDISICVETAVSSRTACRYAGEIEQCRTLGLNEKPKVDETVTEKTQCVKYESKPLVVSRIQTAMKCVKWSKTTEAHESECLKFETKTSIIGKVFNVETFRDFGAEQGQQFVGYTKFEVPNCK